MKLLFLTINIFFYSSFLLKCQEWIDLYSLFIKDSCTLSNKVLIDEFNNKWFHSYKKCGLTMFDNSKFIFYSDSTNWTNIYPLLAHKGVIWCNIWYNYSEYKRKPIGLANFHIDRFEYLNSQNSGLLYDDIETIAADSLGNVWLTPGPSYTTSYDVINFNGNEWKYFTPQTSPFNKLCRVSCIRTHPDSTVWFGTTDGLVSYKSNHWFKYTTENSGLIDNSIPDFEFDSKGRIWIANDFGIVMFDGQSWIKFDSTNSPLNVSSLGVYSKIAVDINDVVWIDTDNLDEIAKFENDEWSFYNISNSMIDDYLWDIQVDKNNNKWFVLNTKIILYREGGVILDSPEVISNQTQLENYPNPFSESTTINFNLEANCEVRLSVFNFLGQEIAVLVKEFLPAGQHSAKFDGTNLPQGTYFYKLQAGSEVRTGKVLLMDR